MSKPWTKKTAAQVAKAIKVLQEAGIYNAALHYEKPEVSIYAEALPQVISATGGQVVLGERSGRGHGHWHPKVDAGEFVVRSVLEAADLPNIGIQPPTAEEGAQNG